MSRHSIRSEVCAWEIEYAERLNKRIAPIVIENVEPGQVHGGLAKLNWIYFTEHVEFDQSFGTLVAALAADIAWIREHSRIGELARQWERRRRKDQLIRGAELRDAEQWAAYRPDNAPELSNENESFPC